MAPPLFRMSWGHGPRVLFVHGLGASARYWERVMAAAGRYRGVAPDLLGFGRSPESPTGSYDVAEHVAALQPLLGPAAVVVGHSTGAILATSLAAAYPARVQGLVLVGLPAYSDEADARRRVAGLGPLARLTMNRAPLARLLCDAMCRVRPLAVAAAPYLIRDLPPSIASDGARHTWASYSRTLENVVIRHRALPDLVSARRPTLLLHGTGDRTAPIEDARRLHEAARAQHVPVRFVEVVGDHHLPIRQVDVVAEAVAQALADQG